MSFMTAERPSLADESQQSSRIERAFVGGQRKGSTASFVRQNLPPVETSQVAGVFRRHVSVGDEQVFPAVVIQVDEQRTPGPAA